MSTQESDKVKLFRESEGKLLCFFLGEREYGIGILEAREVVGMLHVDPVPRTPHFMKGVINLRGKIVPVIDLRLKFGMEEIPQTKDSCIVIIDMNAMMTGLIVDQLVGVVTVKEDDYEEKPVLGQNVNTEFIDGIVKLADRVVIVLDCERILENQEIEAIRSGTEASEDTRDKNE